MLWPPAPAYSMKNRSLRFLSSVVRPLAAATYLASSVPRPSFGLLFRFVTSYIARKPTQATPFCVSFPGELTPTSAARLHQNRGFCIRPCYRVFEIRRTDHTCLSS